MDPEKEIQSTIDLMIKDRGFRIAATRESFRLFFGAYFGRYIKHAFADFHREMFQMAEEKKNRTIIIMGARNSAKSTIMNTGLAIWSILGKPGNHCVVILSQTPSKAK
jgi:ribosome biogenesis GTPase A